MRFLLAILVLVLSILPAASAVDEVVIYNGNAKADRGGMELSSWGSGVVYEAIETHYLGPRALRILSQGNYSGARLELKKPVSLADFIDNPNSYLEIVIKPATALGGTIPAQSGAAGGTAKTPKPVFKADNLRIILITDQSDMVVDGWVLRSGTPLLGGWRQLALPLSSFKSVKEPRGTMIKEIRIFADRADILYVGRIRLMVDTTPMRLVAMARPENAVVGERVSFFADVDAGNATTIIEWDFDKSDGFQIQTQGNKVEWIFNTPGTHIVTCRVTDLHGAKEPVSLELKYFVTGTAKEE